MLKGGLSMSKKIKLFFAYLICMLVSKSSAEAVNVCTDSDDLDETILRKAGFNGRS